MSKYVDAPNSTVSRDTRALDKDTQNLYETVMIVAKRADQVSIQMKEELNAKLEEFAMESDNLEEVFENREQIEISRYYETLPKPTLLATEEFLQDKVYYRNPLKEDAAE